MHIANIGSKTRAFINHKTFHPGNFKNVEAVWQAEEKQRKAEKYAKERADTRAEESRIEQLKGQLRQFEATTSTKNQSIHGLDWMYENPADLDAQNHEEEILLGKKEAVVKHKTVNDHIRPVELDIKGAENGTGDVSEDQLRKLRDDPLYVITLAAHKQREKLMSNPYTRQKVLDKEKEELELTLQETPEGRLLLSLQKDIDSIKEDIKSETRRIEELERSHRNKRTQSATKYIRGLTAEEKQRRLRDMQSDASERQAAKNQRTTHHYTKIKAEENNEVDRIISAAAKRQRI